MITTAVQPAVFTLVPEWPDPEPAPAADSRLLDVVTFSNLTTTTPRAITLPWPALREKLSSHQERTHKDGPLWSPAVYREGMTRSNAAVESVTALAFDVDHAVPDWSLLEGYEYVAHTTFRHAADDPRWRIVLPLTRPVPAAEWTEVGARARAALCPLADTSCKDAARAFYTPACLPGGARFTQRGSGAAVDPEALPPVPPEPTPDAPYTLPAGPTGGRPGDDYAARGSWGELLAAHGWVHESTLGEEQRWRRPDKRKGAGISATIGHKGRDILYVFSSSVPPFEAQKGYSKFTVYALLEHDGDFRAAAKELAAQGYGAPPLPIDLGNRTNGHAGPPAETDDEALPGTVPGSFALTDIGNAERLVARHGAHIRYCHALGKWFVYDGQRWATDATAGIERLAKETARSVYADASRIEDRDERKKVADHARRTEADARVRAMLSRAQAEEGVPVTLDELDADPMLLNVRNGTIDLRTGQLREHAPEDLQTRIAPVVYDPAARLPAWDAFLEQAVPDPDVRRFLQRAVGYSLTGDISEEKLFFVHGDTNTGKGTFFEAIKAALGDYAQQADFETFLARRDVGAPRNDIAILAGARFVCSQEVDEGKRLAEGLVKTLTGGDTVRARLLYKESFEFVPRFKLWLAANHAPRVSDADEAMWRRILRVPFDQVVPKEKRDPRVKATLRDPRQAGPAIVAWAVQGALEWQRHGLGVPTAVQDATDAYRHDMDPLQTFFDECCVLEPDAWTTSGALRDTYETWCRENGERKPILGREFGPRLKARGIEFRPRNGTRGWLGIGLLSTTHQPSEGPETGASGGTIPRFSAA